MTCTYLRPRSPLGTRMHSGNRSEGRRYTWLLRTRWLPSAPSSSSLGILWGGERLIVDFVKHWFWSRGKSFEFQIQRDACLRICCDKYVWRCMRLISMEDECWLGEVIWIQLAGKLDNLNAKCEGLALRHAWKFVHLVVVHYEGVCGSWEAISVKGHRRVWLIIKRYWD